MKAKQRNYTEQTIEGYTFKTYSDNGETIVKINGSFQCVLPSLEKAVAVFFGAGIGQPKRPAVKQSAFDRATVDLFVHVVRLLEKHSFA